MLLIDLSEGAISEDVCRALLGLKKTPVKTYNVTCGLCKEDGLGLTMKFEMYDRTFSGDMGYRFFVRTPRRPDKIVHFGYGTASLCERCALEKLNHARKTYRHSAGIVFALVTLILLIACAWSGASLQLTGMIVVLLLPVIALVSLAAGSLANVRTRGGYSPINIVRPLYRKARKASCIIDPRASTIDWMHPL